MNVKQYKTIHWQYWMFICIAIGQICQWSNNYNWQFFNRWRKKNVFQNICTLNSTQFSKKNNTFLKCWNIYNAIFHIHFSRCITQHTLSLSISFLPNRRFMFNHSHIFNFALLLLQVHVRTLVHSKVVALGKTHTFNIHTKNKTKQKKINKKKWENYS